MIVINSETSMFCGWVKTPDGTYCECEIVEIVPSLFSLLPQVKIKALQGRPFNGFRKAVVSMSRINGWHYKH